SGKPRWSVCQIGRNALRNQSRKSNVVADAVGIEPGSAAPISLLTGKRTGKFQVLKQIRVLVPILSQWSHGVRSKFPADRNREFFGQERGMSEVDQGKRPSGCWKPGSRSSDSKGQKFHRT